MDKNFPEKVIKWAEDEIPEKNPHIKGIQTLKQSTSLFSAEI